MNRYWNLDEDHPVCSSPDEDWPSMVLEMESAPYHNDPDYFPVTVEEIDFDGDFQQECQEAEHSSSASEQASPSGIEKSVDVPCSTIAVASKPRKSRNKCPENCEICGDPATGFHYEVPTCNGCKTFFRRAVMGKRKFSCKNNGNCANLVSKEDRLKCRSCRFERCIDVGMNPYGVQCEAHPEKNEIIKTILLKRRSEVANIEPSTSKGPAKVIMHIASAENLIDRIIDGLLYLELKAELFRTSTYNPDFMDPGYDLRKLLSMHSELGKDHPQMQGWPLSDQQMPNKVPPPIEEIIAKRIPFRDPPIDIPPGVYKNHGKLWTFMDAVCSIEYMKTFDFYHRIDEKDRILIAKNIALCCSQLTAAYYSYSMKRDIMIYPDGTKPYSGHIRRSKHEFLLKKGVIIPLIELNLDKKEYVLLKAILTCNDTIPDISEKCRQLLTAERTKYAKLLFQYVMARRGPVHGPAAYAAILAMIDLHFRLVKQRKDYHLLITILELRKHRAPLIDELAED